MYVLEQALSQVGISSASIGLIIGITLTIVLGSWAALVGLGYFVRKVNQKLTGKKF
jgi:hypothetical protein